jgi:hypothetical protein
MIDIETLDLISRLGEISEEVNGVWVPRDERERRDRIAEAIKSKLLTETIGANNIDDAFGKFYAFEHITISYKVGAEDPNDEVSRIAYKSVPILEQILEKYFQEWGFGGTRIDFCEYFYDNIYLKFGEIDEPAKRRYQEWDQKYESGMARIEDFSCELRRYLNGHQYSLDSDKAQDIDENLLVKLMEALSSFASLDDYWLYFKKWTLGDGTSWYKVGITNDLSRRDAEQNVLPVPAETLEAILLPSKSRAREMEIIIHSVLDSYNIKDAGNKELFSLDLEQEKAIHTALRGLTTKEE